MSATDREREQFDELVAAYRQLPLAEPPPERDRAVLAAARAAVSRPQASRPRWTGMLGTAATLVLAFGLAWQMRDQDLRVPPPAVQGPASAARTAKTASVPAESSSASREAASPAAQVDTPAMTAQDGEARKQEALQVESRKPDDDSGAARARASQDAVSAPKVLERRPEPVAAPAASPPPPAPPAPVQDMREAEATQPEGGFAAPEPVEMLDEASPASAPAPILAEPFPENAPSASAPPHRQAGPPAAVREAAPAPQSAVDAAAPAAPLGAAGIYKRSATEGERMRPEAWLEEIRRLLRQGQRDRARERLAAFRQAYPEASIPEDLRDLGR